MSPTLPLNIMTPKQYEERLMDGDRWVEMVDGQLVRLSPPDDGHGDVVRNLSQVLASHFKRSQDVYACFELPLIVRREPATIRCPAVSCFRIQSEGRFAETDKLMTETRPALVIEIASTNERRSTIAGRVKGYLEWGVTAVWVIDPIERQVHQFHGRGNGQVLKEPQVMIGHPVLSGLAIPVSDLFRQPEWMKSPAGIAAE